MQKLIALLLAAIMSANPASAATYLFNVSGKVTNVEGDAPGSAVAIGDPILGSFTYDDSSIGTGAVLSIGGGSYTIYDAPFTNLQLSVGSYNISYSSFVGSITYMDNAFGQDGIVFLLGGLPGGPFSSTLGNFQLQARGPSTAINSSGATNGLPLDRFETSFFGGFTNGSASKRIYGSLAIAEASAVPEPATWNMMLAGVALIAFQLRTRRRTTRVLAA